VGIEAREAETGPEVRKKKSRALGHARHAIVGTGDCDADAGRGSRGVGVRFALVGGLVTAVQENIAHIIERSFHRSEDLFAKLDMVLSEARADET
jgi:hypothetical protein